MPFCYASSLIRPPSINNNTGIVSGLQARNLESRLNDNLAGAGRSVSSGDRFLVSARKGKYVDASLYQLGQAHQLSQNSPDVDTKRILQAEAVGYDGENISFRDVTQDVLAQEKMERGAAEGENVAEVAGDGEYLNHLKARSKSATLAQNRINGKEYEISKFTEFSEKYYESQQQVTIKTDSGVKIRLDAIGLNSEGAVVINEFKSSETAPLTPNQRSGFPDILNRGGSVIGKGKGIFTNGYRIPQGTKINIDRPSNRRKE